MPSVRFRRFPLTLGPPFLHHEGCAGRTMGTALGQLRRDTDASEDDTAGQPLRLTDSDSLQCLSIFVSNFFGGVGTISRF